MSSNLTINTPERRCLRLNSPGIYLLKVTNENTRTTLFTKNISFWCLYRYLGTDFTQCSGASIVYFEQINADWEGSKDINLVFLFVILHMYVLAF